MLTGYIRPLCTSVPAAATKVGASAATLGTGRPTDQLTIHQSERGCTSPNHSSHDRLLSNGNFLILTATVSRIQQQIVFK